MANRSSLIIAIAVAVVAYYGYKFAFKESQIPSPVVETNYGKLKGIVGLSRDGKKYFEYLGIPYAKPPVGELRYEFPQKPVKWDGIRDASKLGSECAQLNMLLGGNHAGSEDCLFLNIYTKDIKPKTLKPTMVFIHGGAFVFGSSNSYRPDYFMDEDVVLVTLNYRLASFGFLSTGPDGLVRGNMGLKDQVLALKYVQENIAKFGGDPNQVTVFGESAGGASVHHLMLSPMAKGLFSRALSQSGVASCTWATKTKMSDSIKQAQRYAKAANCPVDDTKKMVECLKSLSTAELLDAHSESKGTLKDPMTMFAPTIEHVIDDQTFLAESPEEIMRKGKAHRVPWLTGYNSEEGLLASATVVRDETVLKKFNDDFAKVMPNFLQFDRNVEEKRVKDIMTQARDFYFGPGERIDTPQKMQNFTNIMTDYVWQNQIQSTALVQSQFSPVFPYYYSYKGKFTLTNVLLALKGKYPIVVEFLLFKINQWYETVILGKEVFHYGTCHGDELALQFHIAGIYRIGTDHPDYSISKELVKLWVAFASNEKSLTYKGQEWLPLEKGAKSVKYFHIDATSNGMIDQPNPERLAFWKKLEATKKN